jgi:hypothetical protein
MTSSSRSIFFLLGWLGFLLILASLGTWFAVARSQKSLKAYKSDLERRGETFEISALAPPKRDTSGGEKLGAAAQGLLTLVKSGSSRPFSPGRRETTPGQAEIVHLRPLTIQAGSDVPWDDLRAILDRLRPQLDEIRLAAATPVLEIPSDHSQGFAMKQPFVAAFLASGQYLAAESVLFLRDGKPAKAVSNIQTMIVMASAIGRHPNAISQLVSVALMGLASSATWEILQADVSAPDLLRLQHVWQSVRPSAHAAWTLRMERAWGVQAFAAPNAATFSLTGKPVSSSPTDKILAAASALFWNTFLRSGEELWYLEQNQNLLNQLDHHGWKDVLAVSAQIHADTASHVSRRPFASLMLNPLHGLLEKLALTDAMQGLCVTAIAIRRHQLDHAGQPPDSLQDLVPSYLNTIPRDIMDGQPLRYRRDGQNFLLYALGQNGEDDGGNPVSPSGKRRRDLLDGLDIVWPQAAPAVTPASGGSGPGTLRE